MIAFMLGWVNQRIRAVINTEISHIQIHQLRFLETNEIQDFIPDISLIASDISGKPGVKAVSTRVIAPCMAATAETGAGIQLTGVDPMNESQVTNINELIIDGEYLAADRSNQILIGEKLALKLNAKIRSRIVITLTEVDGTLTRGTFRVAGIYRTANTAYDEVKAFVSDDDLRNLLKLDENTGHEIAILMSENGPEESFAGELAGLYPGLSVMKWTEIMPEMSLMNESMNLMMYIFIVIILLALGFGIVNTMLMVILERIKEIGMLMAVGMNRMRVFSMIVLETVFLSLTGGVAGIALALLLTSVTAKTGIDLSLWATGLNSMGFDSIVYPYIGIEQVFVVALLVAATGVLSAIYPARKAIKLKPAEALRIDM